MNYATRTFSAIYFLQFSRKESCWQSFNLGFQLGKKEQKKDLTFWLNGFEVLNMYSNLFIYNSLFPKCT